MIVDISDKVIVVTGSSRGIGREIAKRLAHENAKVVINYRNSENDALKTHEEISRFNKNCIAVKADITKQNDVKRLYRTAVEAFGRIDVLINNAGMCSDNLMPLMSEKQWKSVIDVNLNGVFLCCKWFAREMIKKRYGKIINIASLKGQLGSEGQVNYSASKAGVIGFTKALAKELGKFNISVNAVCPGFIVTDLNRHNEKKRKTAEKMSVMNCQNSLPDLLDFIVYISSDKFTSVSGRVFNIDSRLSQH